MSISSITFLLLMILSLSVLFGMINRHLLRLPHTMGIM